MYGTGSDWYKRDGNINGTGSNHCKRDGRKNGNGSDLKKLPSKASRPNEDCIISKDFSLKLE